MALLALDRYHTSLGSYEMVSVSKEDALKRSIIAAGINGWRRGREPMSWKAATIEDAVWRAVLLGFDLARDADFYEKWEEVGTANRQSPREFLEAKGRLRRTAIPEDDSPTYFVSVQTSSKFTVEMPFLFQQAVACLFQNAIRAADGECGKKGPREPITITATTRELTIRNPGRPIPVEIRTLINESASPEQFESRVLAMVRSAGAVTLGIGLSEAYTIATQCYGGLRIMEDEAAISLMLRPGKAAS